MFKSIKCYMKVKWAKQFRKLECPLYIFIWMYRCKYMLYMYVYPKYIRPPSYIYFYLLQLN